MAVISPSTVSGGRNTGFSYVFNASRAVFQDSVQSIAAKNVTHKDKYVSDSRKCNSESMAEKIKDDVTSTEKEKISVETPAVKKIDTTKSVRAAECSTGPSNITSRTDRTKFLCSNNTAPCAGKQDNSESLSQKKRSSNKGLLSDAKNVKENANVATGVGIVTPATGLSATKGKITENISENKTSVQKFQLKNAQNTSSKPLAGQSPVAKFQKPQTDSGQTVADKISTHQSNCGKIDKLSGEQNKREIINNENECLIKSKAETASSCATNIKTFDEKGKKEISVNKSSSKNYLKDEKISKSTNVIQQKNIAQGDVNSGSVKNTGKSNEREKIQNSENKGKTNVKSKEKVKVNSTNKIQSEGLQSDTEVTNKNSDIKSQKEIPSETSEKPQGSVDKVSIVEQTFNKYKKSFTKPHVDPRTDKSSEKPISKFQKATRDPVNSFPSQKSLNSNVEIKTNEKSVVKPPASLNQTSVDKLIAENKKPETPKKIIATSQASPVEPPAEKSKKDEKNEIGSSRQAIKFQKDTLQSLASTSVATSQGHDVKKEPFHKETSVGSKENNSADKSQIDNSKTEKSIVKTSMPASTGKTSAKSLKEDVKSETSRKFPRESEKGTTKQFGDKSSVEKLGEGDLTTEKVRKDNIGIEMTNSDVISHRLNSPIAKKQQEKFEIEKSEKPLLKLQEDSAENVISKSAGKPLQGPLAYKRNEKKIGQIQKEMQSVIVTGSLQHQSEKAPTDKIMDKSVTKTQKDVLSSTGNKSTNEQEANNNKSCTEKFQADSAKDHPGKKVFSKPDDKQSSVNKNPTKSTPKENFKEKISENPIIKSQKDNIEKLSSGDKLLEEKTSLKNLSGAKISTAKSQKDIVQDNISKTMTSSAKDTILVDNLQINCDGNLNGEISAVKRRTDITSHCSGASETSFQSTLEKSSTSLQMDNEKAAPKSKVSKLSTQESKNQYVQTSGIVSCQTPKSKLDFDKMIECKDRTFTTISQPDNTQKRDMNKICAESSPVEMEKISKLNFSDSSSNKTSSVASGKISEMNSLNTLQSLNNDKSVSDSELKLHDLDLGDKCKYIAHQNKITHPSQSVTSSDPVNNQNLKSDFAVFSTQELSVKNRRHIKENRPCSYPSTEHKDFYELQQRSSSQQSLDCYTRDCTLSPVDYAKSRFQNVQQTPRCDEVMKPRPKHTQMVNEFKSLWENYEQKETGIGIPHPKFRKIHMRKRMSSLSSDGQSDADFPIRPFLTKGSVAERVLLFECCPERALDRSSGKSKSLLYNTWKSAGLHHKTRFWEVIGEKDRPPRSFYIQRDKENWEPSKAAAFCRFSKSSNVFDIPLFHYPKGRPLIKTEIEKQLKEIKAVFSAFTDEKVTKEEFGIITKACGVPLYWKFPLFLSAAGENKPFLKCDVFLQYWRRIISIFHDEASQFVAVLTKCSRNYLLPDDFISMIQDIIDTHPGLTFLKEATEFHSRYVHTVISRIYYCVNKSWSGKITVAELRKSNFLQIVSLLEKEDDINQITDYFSYEHFYVIYCKFWELDKDHDLFIDKNDLRRHNDGAISSRMIERIFSGAVTHSPACKEGKMSYTDFVWFLFSEEDKRHPRSIEYWFRCMDLDGDGYLSMYEMEYFYEEQLQRMAALSIETLPFKDCLCQMLDMIRPKIPGLISLSDLKKCKMTPLFFDTFFNLEKYLDYEQRDPFASQREQDNDSSDMSDWDRYAAEEYELLVAEEGSSEPSDDLMYEDYNQEEEEVPSGTQKITGASIINRSGSAANATDEDYGDTDLTYY